MKAYEAAVIKLRRDYVYMSFEIINGKLVRKTPDLPCKDRVLALLDEKDWLRGELKKQLFTEDYSPEEVQQTLAELKQQNKITLDGSSYSPKQKISKIAPQNNLFCQKIIT